MNLFAVAVRSLEEHRHIEGLVEDSHADRSLEAALAGILERNSAGTGCMGLT